MPFNYKPLWKQLIDLDIDVYKRQVLGISPGKLLEED